MIIVGCDFHPAWQQAAWVDTETGETSERKLEHSSDYRLGWSDGLKVMSEIRTKYPDEPVIMFTGSGDEDVIQRAMHAGATDYVVKSMRHRARLGLALQRALEKVREREALRRTERLATVGQMMGALAHEINNPLDAVRNLLYLIARQPDAPDAVRDYAKIAEAEISRATEIARKTLGFVRESPFEQPVAMKEILDDTLSLFQKRFEQGGIQLIRDYSPLHVWGSATELRQVITNLIANGAEAMESTGGTLRVRMRAHAGQTGRKTFVTIMVADTGPGIPRSAQRHIMRPFFTTKGNKGTGLGLWISNDIVQKHGGTLRFRTVTAGKHTGTCFRVALPQSRGEAADESAGAA